MKIVIITKDNRTIELTEQDLNDEVVFIREPNKVEIRPKRYNVLSQN